MVVRSVLPPALVALAFGFVLQPVVLRVMTARAVMDMPSARSSHRIPTPRGGGVAVALAAIAALMFAPQARLVAVPLLLFAVIGLAEDVRGVPIVPRLLLQFGAGAVSTLVLLPDSHPGAVTIALVAVIAIWLAAYANAFNFMDGINGISTAHAMLTGLLYAGLGRAHELPVLSVAGVVIAAASLTFAPWNAGRARIFLGDVGSYALGGVLASLAAYGVLHGVAVEAALAPLALYIADTGWALLRRWRRGVEWYRPHREHVYQQLTDSGWSHQRVTLATIAVSSAVCLCGVLAGSAATATRLTLDGLALMLLGGYLAVPALLASVRRHTSTDAVSNSDSASDSDSASNNANALKEQRINV